MLVLVAVLVDEDQTDDGVEGPLQLVDEGDEEVGFGRRRSLLLLVDLGRVDRLRRQPAQDPFLLVGLEKRSSEKVSRAIRR